MTPPGHQARIIGVELPTPLAKGQGEAYRLVSLKFITFLMQVLIRSSAIVPAILIFSLLSLLTQVQRCRIKFCHIKFRRIKFRRSQRFDYISFSSTRVLI